MADCKPEAEQPAPNGGQAEEHGNDEPREDSCDVPNFSWICEGLLCACAFPTTVAHLRYLANQGVTCIVSLTAERDLPEHDIPGLRTVKIKVEDFTPPTLDQIQQFIQTVEEAERQHTAVAVHCAAGKGRTGTVIACYLVKRLRYTAEQAIQHVRCLRPGSVETAEQENMVSKFQSTLGAAHNCQVELAQAACSADVSEGHRLG